MDPDDMIVEARKCFRYLAVNLLSKLFNDPLEGKRCQKSGERAVRYQYLNMNVKCKSAVVTKG